MHGEYQKNGFLVHVNCQAEKVNKDHINLFKNGVRCSFVNRWLWILHFLVFLLNCVTTPETSLLEG